MWSTLPPRSEAERPPQIEPECSRFWTLYLLAVAPLLYVAIVAAVAALWPADSTTTSSPAPAAGSSSTACPASTAGSSR